MTRLLDCMGAFCFSSHMQDAFFKVKDKQTLKFCLKSLECKNSFQNVNTEVPSSWFFFEFLEISKPPC